MSRTRQVSRRQILLATSALAALGCTARLEPLASATEGSAPDPEPTPTTTDPAPPGSATAPSTPAPTPPEPTPTSTTLRGRVIEVSHPNALGGSGGGSMGTPTSGAPNDAAVQAMLTRAMLELTGKATEEEAWKVFFGPSDVVGLKVSPVGFPSVYSHAATLKAIVRGLGLAGVPLTSIVVFDRYRDMLDACGYPGALPSGVRFAGIVPTYTDEQTQLPGYDANEYVDLPRVYDGNDPNDPAKRRSYLAEIVSKQVTKIVNIPALKDHVSAGVTCALKNITYGMVNNVSRTHQAPDNWTKDFIPAIAAMKKIRDKVVLHVGDALRVGYEGGPAADTMKTNDYRALIVAADPVALDRVGWAILDDLRAKNGYPALASAGLKLTNAGGEAYDQRQPQHVLAAGAAGLGEPDLAKIQRVKIAL